MSPGITQPQPVTFHPVAETKLVTDYADLTVVDLATYDDGLAAQKILAEQIRKAMTTQGFFVLKNHGFSQEESERALNIGWTALNQTSDEEKLRLKAPMLEKGVYHGFKLRGVMLGPGGTKDKIEQFNWFRSCEKDELPDAIKPFKQELKVFSKKMHTEVLFKILRLFAIALELDTEFFVNKFQFDKPDQSWLRCMAYYDEFTKEEEQKRGGVWFAGHHDFNMLSMLFSQPMASLQVQAYSDEGKWKFIPYVPGAMIINCGSFCQWYTGGYFKAAIHRVVQPPDDQRNHTRCSMFMFVVPNGDETIETISTSPVLNAYPQLERCQPVNSDEFAHARISVVGQSAQHKTGMKAGEKAYQVVNGVKLQMFG